MLIYGDIIGEILQRSTIDAPIWTRARGGQGA